MKAKAWSHQKKLKQIYQDSEVPNMDEIYNMIKEIRIVGKQTGANYVKRARALIAIYYLTACRQTEILPVNKFPYRRLQRESYIDEFGKKNRKFVTDDNGYRIVEEGINERKEEDVDHYKGLRARHIKEKQIDGKRFIEIRTQNRKHKERRTKVQLIPVEKEYKIYEFVKDYIQYLDPNMVLFELKRSRVKEIIKELTGFNVHFWRHIRLTHLVTVYDFNEQLLIKFAGWTDGRPAKNYMELSQKDMARAFYKNE